MVVGADLPLWALHTVGAWSHLIVLGMVLKFLPTMALSAVELLRAF